MVGSIGGICKMKQRFKIYRENIQLLTDDFWKLPLFYDKSKDVKLSKLIQDQFDVYLKKINRFNGTVESHIKSNRGIIEKVIEDLVNVLECYYDGKPAKAYTILDKCLIQINNRLIIKPNESDKKKPDSKNTNIYLFRMRKDNGKELTNKDLFHISLHEREKISSQRYSIAGYPCLYLGGSLLTCAEETGSKNDFENCFCSIFELDFKKFSFLDLSLTSDHIVYASNETLRKIDSGELTPLNYSGGELFQLICNFIVTLPLILVCSVINVNKNLNYQPEYFIPQLLLEWIRSNKKLDGIKYTSNRAKTIFYPNRRHVNYVFAPKQIDSDGFCKNLKENLKISKPISAKQIMRFEPSRFMQTISEEDLDLYKKSKFNRTVIRNIVGNWSSYEYSIFGRMELELLKMKRSKIK